MWSLSHSLTDVSRQDASHPYSSLHMPHAFPRHFLSEAFYQMLHARCFLPDAVCFQIPLPRLLFLDAFSRMHSPRAKFRAKLDQPNFPNEIFEINSRIINDQFRMENFHPQVFKPQSFETKPQTNTYLDDCCQSKLFKRSLQAKYSPLKGFRTQDPYQCSRTSVPKRRSDRRQQLREIWNHLSRTKDSKPTRHNETAKPPHPNRKSEERGSKCKCCNKSEQTYGNT